VGGPDGPGRPRRADRARRAARCLTQFDLVGIIFGFFYGPDWRGLAELLVALDTGAAPADASAAALAARDGARKAQAGRPELAENSFQPQFCGDWELPVRNYAEFAVLLRAQRLVAPEVLYSPLALSATTACSAGRRRPTTRSTRCGPTRPRRCT
jgi:hypothetical protein